MTVPSQTGVYQHAKLAGESNPTPTQSYKQYKQITHGTTRQQDKHDPAQGRMAGQKAASRPTRPTQKRWHAPTEAGTYDENTRWRETKYEP